MRALLRSPALHFLVLGAALFAAARTSSAPAGPAGDSDEELLYRAALELGVDRRDRAVQERLARLGRFVGEDDADEAALAAEARRLGLARSDLVVKRHLVSIMGLAAGRLLPADVPTDGDVRAWIAAHPDEVTLPARVRFTHVYLARDRHGTVDGALDETARTILTTLRRDRVPLARGAAAGDPFIAGAEIGPLEAADVDRRFGPGFATALAEIAPREWAGPIRSSYGLHLVWIEERLPATMPPFEAVRGRVVHRLLRERRDTRARERIAALRAR